MILFIKPIGFCFIVFKKMPKNVKIKKVICMENVYLILRG